MKKRSQILFIIMGQPTEDTQRRNSQAVGLWMSLWVKELIIYCPKPFLLSFPPC